jgi:23S rRNA (uracil1939-C5)-methyltransferase
VSGERPPTAVRLAALDEIEVTVEKLVAGGEGFARFEGIPIFVPRSAPGDRLRARLVERRPDYGRAEIVELLAPGPGRRPPPCPYFERCGGCDLQHLDDDHQVRYKAAAAVETLERLGGVELPGPPEVVAGAAWGYRLRTQLHTEVGPVDGREDVGGAVRVGYFARGSHDLVAVDRCPILAPELEAELARLPGLLAAAAGGGERLPRRLDLAVGDGGSDRGAITAAPMIEGLPHGEVALTLDGPPGVGELTYTYDARCFFQTHRELAGELMRRAVGAWEGETAYDLYAGVGLLALPLARRYRRVVAVEGDRVSARHARNNARRNRAANLQVEARAVESWIDRLPEGAARVVVDPPRAGLSRKVRHTLFRARPERLTYVSCHPATLARDLKGLRAAYRVESLALLDLFPQSGHVEAVVQLVAREREVSGHEAKKEEEKEAG